MSASEAALGQGQEAEYRTVASLASLAAPVAAVAAT